MSDVVILIFIGIIITGSVYIYMISQCNNVMDEDEYCNKILNENKNYDYTEYA